MLFAEAESTTLLMTAVATLAGVLVAIAGAAWKAASWIKSEVVMPVVADHRSLIAALKAAVPEQRDILVQTLEMLKRQTASLADIESNISSIRSDTFEHLALQRTEMVHLEDIRSNGSKVVSLLESHVIAKVG